MPKKIQLWICEKIRECGINNCSQETNKAHTKQTFCEVGYYCTKYKIFVKCVPIKSQGE
jgi:hypothetical protein